MALEVATALDAARAMLPASFHGVQLHLLHAGSAVVIDVDGGPVHLIARVSAAELLPDALLQERLTTYLARHRVAVALPATDVAGARHITFGDCTVTVALWHHVDHDSNAETPPGRLGALLADLHRCPVPGWLPRLDPLAPVRRWLREMAGSGVATEPETRLLADALQRAEGALEKANTDEGLRSIVHGDLLDNVLTSPGGPVIIDWETAGAGPASWDLVKFVGAVRRFGYEQAQLDELLAGYLAAGGDPDVTCDTGSGALDDIAVLLGAAFTVISRPYGEHFVAESAIRMATLGGQKGLRWTSL
jgi:Phosphotransferase enzyme family